VTAPPKGRIGMELHQPKSALVSLYVRVAVNFVAFAVY
jgi:hypothetical protein